MQNTLPRPALMKIYKVFIGLHLDYGDVLYVQAYNTSIYQKLERIQCKDYLAITGAIRGTSKKELGLDSLLNLLRGYAYA